MNKFINNSIFLLFSLFEMTSLTNLIWDSESGSEQRSPVSSIVALATEDYIRFDAQNIYLRGLLLRLLLELDATTLVVL